MSYKKEIWLFNSATTFSGNVKFLFIYCNELHKQDIDSYYITDNEENYNFIKQLDFKVVKFNTSEGKQLLAIADVYVTEQYKEKYPIEFTTTNNNIKILNLYHGVGLKNIERNYKQTELAKILAKKWIIYNELFNKNTMFLVTSPFMEKHFVEEIGLIENQIIRAGYPRNIFFNIFNKYNYKNQDPIDFEQNKQYIIYCPTFREDDLYLIENALPNLFLLNNILIKNNQILYIKLHPRTLIKQKYDENYFRNFSNIKFWDNKYDLYDYLNKFDIAIIDYSSIFYDMLCFGIKKFIRYVWDLDKYNNNKLKYDYIENTTGEICTNFEHLLDLLNNKQNTDDKIPILIEKYWKYSNNNSFENIIESIRKFSFVEYKYKVLHSFDLWDTLLERKCGLPIGIFFHVQQKIKNLKDKIPLELINNFVNIRINCEKIARETSQKDNKLNKEEIYIDDIYRKIQNIYHIDDSTLNFIKETEFNCEKENVILNQETYSKIEKILENNEDIIFISDMYWDSDRLRELITTVAPKLKDIKIFVSCEEKYQKHTGNLYWKIFQEYGISYNYVEWHHYGDNIKSDGEQPKKLGIYTHIKPFYKFNQYENYLIKSFSSYEGFCLVNKIRQFRQTHKNAYSYYGYAHLCAYLMPYINWLLKDAIKNNIKELFFISRDGLILKQIADQIINIQNLKIKTKYIYGSRKAWRAASQINEIDDEFFSYFGNFTGVTDKDTLIKALNLSQQQFYSLFGKIQKPIDVNSIINRAKNNNQYKKIFCNNNKNDLKLISRYLKQEITLPLQEIAFVEFWARGYTQDCLNNLLQLSDIGSKTTFYYFRSIMDSSKNSRRINYSCFSKNITFIEALFANNPYESLEQYTEKDGKVVPLLKENKDFNLDMFNRFQQSIEIFVKDMYSFDQITLNIFNNLSLDWFYINPQDMEIVKTLGGLKYSETMWGTQKEYAPPLTKEQVKLLQSGYNLKNITKSVPISLARTNKKLLKDISFDKNNIKKGKALLSKLNNNFELYCFDSKYKILHILNYFIKIPLLGNYIKIISKQIILKIINK